MQSTGFRSGYEERVAANLTKAGIEYTYEANCLAYEIHVRGSACKKCGGAAVYRTAHYTPDFYLKNGSYVETKGKFTSANRTRMAAFRVSRPDVVLRVLLQANNYLTKKRLSRYSDWLTKHGIEWAVGEVVPVEWTR